VPPYNRVKDPVTVHFKSDPNSEAFCLYRKFAFNKVKPFVYNTRMFKVVKNEVKEQMNYGICWHSFYSWDGEKVLLQHKGYSLQIRGHNLTLPITWLIGACNAFETPVDDNSFDMCASIDHWLLGRIYEYKGRFIVTKEV